MTSRYDDETLTEWRARTEAAAERRETAPNFVYRALDSYGLLLYVGCSLDVAGRLSVHRREADWFRYAETVGITGPYTRSKAMGLEREAIETERPYFNSSMANHRLVQMRHPLATSSADRLARYLVVREDAELARQESAA